MTPQEAATMLREWYIALDRYGKGNEQTVKEFLDISDLLEDLAKRVPRWISVEERLPPKHMGEYLCLCALDDDPTHEWDWMMVLRWHAFDGNGVVDRPHFTDEGVNGMMVTHWMPLPAIPEEKKEDDHE